MRGICTREHVILGSLEGYDDGAVLNLDFNAGLEVS